MRTPGPVASVRPAPSTSLVKKPLDVAVSSRNYEPGRQAVRRLYRVSNDDDNNHATDHNHVQHKISARHRPIAPSHGSRKTGAVVHRQTNA